MAKGERSGFGAVALVVVVLAVLVGGGWAGAYAFAGDKLPNGTTVGGVAVGGMSRADALDKLRRSERTGAVTLTAGGKSAQVTAAGAGLSMNWDASLAKAGGKRSWDPRALWDHYTGGRDITPVVEVDSSKMTATVEQLDQQLGVAPKDGAVAFGSDGVKVTDAVTGHVVDPGAVKGALVDWFATGHKPSPLTLHDGQPAIGEPAVQDAVNSFANPAMSGPVTLTFGSSPVTLTPQQYAGALSLTPQNGKLVPQVDAGKIQALVAAATTTGAPVNATVVLRGGKPVVVPGKPGTTYDPALVVSTFQGLLTQPSGARSATIPSTTANPQVSTADATKWGIKEKVSSFTTYFPYAAYRNQNIGRAASIVNGTVLKPGDTFSLNGTVGERTAANGFTSGWTIQDGVFKADLGGGVSQVATTTFNAMFFAGLQDVEHHPHSVYISRYPMGREATVAWGALDLKFKNDTPYGVLIEEHVSPSTPSSQGSITVSMWSTKTWDITTTTGAPYKDTPFTTTHVKGSNCEPGVGENGFDIDIWRYFHHVGSSAVVKTEKMHTHYDPLPTTICDDPTKPPS